MKALNCLSALVVVAFLAAPQTLAETRTFDFEDPKGVNAVGIFLDGDVEHIFGVADGITGKVSYDPQQPATFKGQIDLAVSSIQLSNERMTQVMRGADWLAADEYKTIRVEFLEATVDDRDDNSVELEVKTRIHAMGRTIDKTLEIDVELIPDGADKRGGGSGDLLVLESDFYVDRRDLGIKPNMDDTKVAHKIEIDVAIAGYEVK